MKNLFLLAAAIAVANGCMGATPNDDPKASVAGTNRFRHEMPGTGQPAPLSRPDMSKK